VPGGTLGTGQVFTKVRSFSIRGSHFGLLGVFIFGKITIAIHMGVVRVMIIVVAVGSSVGEVVGVLAAIKGYTTS